MRKTNHLFSLIGLALILALTSCSTSDQVTTGKFIQKRKYNKGYHMNLGIFNKKSEVAQNNVELKQETSVANDMTASNNIEAEVKNAIEVASSEKIANSLNTLINKEAKKESISPETQAIVSTQLKEIAAENGLKGLNKIKALVAAKKIKKLLKKSSAPSKGLLYVLCIFIPVLAVGLATDWEMTPVISNLLWYLLCGIPAIIHAFIVVGREA